jgi:hypothetical protein
MYAEEDALVFVTSAVMPLTQPVSKKKIVKFLKMKHGISKKPAKAN